MPEPISEAVPLEYFVFAPGAGGRVRQVLQDRISMGRTDIRKLTGSDPGITADLAETLSRESTRKSFYAMSLTCTFYPGEPAISEAEMMITLRRRDDRPEDPPLAWSLDPLMLATPVQYTRTWSLKANVTVVPNLLGGEGAGSATESSTRQRFYLIAVGEKESRAGWHFKETEEVKLVGIHHLLMVIQSPSHAECVAEIELQATLKGWIRRLRGIVPPRSAEVIFAS
jgi:hypothetical protein